jgi:hypothetical protein
MREVRQRPSRKIAADKVNASYLGRVLRLTLLALDIAEAILDGWLPAEVTLAVLMRCRSQWRGQSGGRG